MAENVIIKLTLAEAEQLDLVAGNGWGDGDFYNLNEEPRYQTAKERRAAKVFQSAREKLQQAINASKTGTDHCVTLEEALQSVREQLTEEQHRNQIQADSIMALEEELKAAQPSISECVEEVKRMKAEADGYDETLFDAIIERLESLQSKPG